MVSIINNDGAGREVKKERKLRCKGGGGVGGLPTLEWVGVLDKHGDGENRKPNYKSGEGGELPKLVGGWGAEKAGRWGG